VLRHVTGVTQRCYRQQSRHYAQNLQNFAVAGRKVLQTTGQWEVPLISGPNLQILRDETQTPQGVILHPCGFPF